MTPTRRSKKLLFYLCPMLKKTFYKLKVYKVLEENSGSERTGKTFRLLEVHFENSGSKQ